MRRVDFTKKAQQRFQELHDNISEHQSPKAAKKFVEDFSHTIGLVQKIQKCLQSLHITLI